VPMAMTAPSSQHPSTSLDIMLIAKTDGCLCGSSAPPVDVAPINSSAQPPHFVSTALSPLGTIPQRRFPSKSNINLPQPPSNSLYLVSSQRPPSSHRPRDRWTLAPTPHHHIDQPTVGASRGDVELHAQRALQLLVVVAQVKIESKV